MPIAQSPNDQNPQMKAELGPLTMVHPIRPWLDVASEILCDGLVSDAFVRLHTNGAIYKAFAGHENASSTRYTRVTCVGYALPHYSPAKIISVWPYSVATVYILQIAPLRRKG